MQLNHLILNAARILVTTGKQIQSENWQGTKLQQPMHEAIKVYLRNAIMPLTIQSLQEQTKANQPWAEEHFKERIGGKPTNPGEQYKHWPFYRQDDKMRNVEQKGSSEDGSKVFSHTYQERFWPKYAGPQPIGEGHSNTAINWGIRFHLGDLIDVIQLLNKDPHTRQAYLPIWFPEDTGAVHGGRVPCTLGYLFQIRDNHLHMTYYIRSCDFIRHFKDDIYLAVRLVQYMVTMLKAKDNKFRDLVPGMFDMHIGSLHIFEAELPRVKKEFQL